MFDAAVSRVARVVVLALVATAFAAMLPVRAHAAEYDPTYVITDDNMRDFSSMSAADIQTFLDTKTGPLKTLQTTDYAGVKRSAAEIIWHAAQAWHINPKILIVTLQKEQSLISTSNSANAARLLKAMGCGVYDVDGDGDIDNLYPGFGKQVWNAARLYDKYGETYDTSSARRAWATSGHRIYDYNLKKYVTVYPKNVATMKLYVYTPYSSGPKSTQTLYTQYFGSAFASPRYRPVYRFVKKTNGTYFYTKSIAEWHRWRTADFQTRWTYDGKVFSEDTSVPVDATVPVYRFYNKVTTKYSFTSSKTLYDERRSAAGAKTWSYGGVAFRASREATQGAVTVHRFINRYTGGNLLTASQSTVDKVAASSALRKKWRYEGPAYYLPRFVEPTSGVLPVVTP